MRDLTAIRNFDDATRLVKLKSIMLASTSHEFRNPLSGIINMLNLLKPSIVEKKQKKYLKIAKVSTNLLLNLSNDLLDYS